VLHDEQTCLPGVGAHGGRAISVTKDDQRVLDYTGGSAQDQDTYVYVYDRRLGCRWLNTQTGQVGGAWGPTGTYRGDKGWTIHNARISKNGNWARISPGSGGGPAGLYFWNIDSMSLTPCNWNSQPYCGGHLVTGFESMINHRQLGDGMEFAVRPMANVDRATALITPLLTPAQYG